MTSRYVLVETADPFESANFDQTRHFASVLAVGRDVMIYLAQNAVFGARASHAAAPELSALTGNVSILADDFSLRERGIDDAELAAGVTSVPIERLVELMVETGSKTVWH